MSKRKRGGKCIACAGSGTVTRPPKLTFIGFMHSFSYGIIRCNRCGGTGREK